MNNCVQVLWKVLIIRKYISYKTRLWYLWCIALSLIWFILSQNQHIQQPKPKCFALKSWEVRYRLMVLWGTTFDFDKSAVCSSPFSPSLPESIVINNLYTKTGSLEYVLRRCWAAPNSTNLLHLPSQQTISVDSLFCWRRRQSHIFRDWTVDNIVTSFLYAVVKSTEVQSPLRCWARAQTSWQN